MTTLLGAVAGTIEAGWNVLYSSVLSVTGTLGGGKPAEGFYPTSTYGKDFVEGGEGGDDIWKQYAPYLHQTERSSREQRDNHRWPTTRELLGSTEQTLRDREPVLPCHYPRPSLKASRWNA